MQEISTWSPGRKAVTAALLGEAMAALTAELEASKRTGTEEVARLRHREAFLERVLRDEAGEQGGLAR